jgi:myo-inositol-1(or 4)-monophosphatase
MMATMLDVAIESTIAAGAVLKKYWGRLPSIEHKNHPGDVVTVADRESEKAIISILQSHYPDHGIIAEESGISHGINKEYTWVIDPLDGTVNYTHQYPMVSVSVALLKNKEIILGVIFDPIYEDLFFAEKGKGAYHNQKKISVSKTTDLMNSLLATGFAYDRRVSKETNYAQFCHMTHISQGVRRGGSAALDLAYVACGRLDGFWEKGLQSWDLAAGALLVKEAGGSVTSYDKKPFDLFSGKILASNGQIHDVMSKELLAVNGVD